MSKLAKETLYRHLLAIWNDRKLTIINEIIASDYVRHDPAFPGQVRGPEGFKQYVAAMWGPFPDAQVSIEDIFAEGDRIAMRWTFRGTHTGEFTGIPATGKEVAVVGISIVRIEGNKIVEGWDGYDALGILRQVGAAP